MSGALTIIESPDTTDAAGGAAAPWVLFFDRPPDVDPASARPEPQVLTGPGTSAAEDLLGDVNRSDPAAVASAVATRMRTEDQALHAGLYLALSTPLCFSAEVGTKDLPRRARRSVLEYRFEDRLPVPLEDVEVDFVDPAGTGGRGVTLGVAVARDWLSQLCAALAQAGVEVVAISPVSLLVAQALLESVQRPAGPGADLLLVRSEFPGVATRTEAVVLAPADDAEAAPVPEGWFGFAAAPADGGPGTRARMVVERIAAARGRALRVWAAADVDARLLAGLRALPGVLEVQRLDHRHGGGELPARPWIDLRRGGLDPTRTARDTQQWRRWSVVAMVVLALLTAGFWVRGSRYAASQTQAHDRVAAAYRQASGSRGTPPASPVRALRSVLAERQAARGTERGVSGAWAHDRMFNALRALPDDGSVRVMKLTADPDTVQLVAQTQDHVAADRVASALSRSGATGLLFSVNRATLGDDSSAVTVDLVGRAPGTGGGGE